MKRAVTLLSMVLIGTWTMLCQTHAVGDGQAGDGLARWLARQTWRRDVQHPVLRLGNPGAFDDTHVFAPCVFRAEDGFWMWYCGSRGSVAERVFSLGLAGSPDGRRFQRLSDEPVFSFGDGKHSVLTPTLLREADGSALREAGKLRMWFSATHFAAGDGRHTLHEATSDNGVHWSAPSPAQLEFVYAPSVLKEGDRYRLWYTDVSRDPWVIRHAASPDGQGWDVDEQPVLILDQPWESDRLFYPTVVKTEGVYLMWYGSYWSVEESKTAIGFAVSRDGIEWHKHPRNPVLRPDPSRFWESHYTTSQSIIRDGDGSFRIWYATRKRPPFVNKYFAIGTATWTGPR